MPIWSIPQVTRNKGIFNKILRLWVDVFLVDVGRRPAGLKLNRLQTSGFRRFGPVFGTKPSAGCTDPFSGGVRFGTAGIRSASVAWRRKAPLPDLFQQRRSVHTQQLRGLVLIPLGPLQGLSDEVSFKVRDSLAQG